MYNILLIEDNASDALILRKACEEAGFQGNFLLVDNGNKAIDILQHESWNSVNKVTSYALDVVILDLGLPAMSGHEILMQIRNSPSSAKLPVIVLTSSDNPRDKETALNNGAVLFLSKPYDLDGYMKIAEQLVVNEFPRLKPKL